MNATLSTASRPGAPAGETRGATLALARVEGRRLLTHPAVLIGALLVLLIWGISASTGSDRLPVLHYAAFEVPLELLPVIVAALIATNLAALRSHRHGTDDFYGVVPMPAWRRTLAHLLSSLPLAIAAGLVAAARVAQLATRPGAVGRPDPLELAVAPVLVLLFAAVGVLLARVIRSAVVAPLLLAVVAFSTMFGLIFLLPFRLRWLSPIVPELGTVDGPQPADLLGRPAGVHLIYLAALVILVGAGALLRVGAPRLPTAATAAAATVITAVTGGLQLSVPSDEVLARQVAAMNAPAASQRCERRDTVTYCAFPDYLPRAAEWHRVVDRVRQRVPGPQADRPFTVRQRVISGAAVTTTWQTSSWHPGSVTEHWAADDRRAGTPNPLPVGTAWGKPYEQTAFAARVAERLINGAGGTATAGSAADGSADAGSAAEGNEGTLLCGGIGVLTLWLAGQATPGAAAELTEQAANTSARVIDLNPVSVGPMLAVGRREVGVAVAALGQPTERIAGIVNRSWPELTSPRTTVDQAAQLLGGQAPAALGPVPPGEESIFGDCG